MKWKKFTLTTTTEAVDLISYTLDELGIEGDVYKRQGERYYHQVAGSPHGI